ncbi:MAG: hypothetical protein PWR12_64 [Eubacteriaceae bacterium]|jgi:PAS domain-containing protein|nr:hypothetical protein [Eubacteriaceae bacterium]MDK2903988.1 hypothetical protein [Eubacteriaceae bacterium]MDK2961203.1 hypothetical protein [Eubacteriaceae bacterium]
MDRNFYQQLTETSPCGFAIVNVLCENNQANDYEFCQCNTAFLNHIGLQRRQVISVWQHLNMN